MHMFYVELLKFGSLNINFRAACYCRLLLYFSSFI